MIIVTRIRHGIPGCIALWIILAVISCTMAIGSSANAQTVDILRDKPKTVPSKGAFYTHDWSQWNLFQRSGNGDGADRIKKNWAAIIGTDQSKPYLQLIYELPGDPTQKFLYDPNDGDCRTEGQSYGLMMAVQMDDKDTFAKLWKFTKLHLQYDGAPPSNYYFHWRIGINADKTLQPLRSFDGPAADGDIWIAAALLNAAGRWDNAEYRLEANRVLNTFLHTEDINAAAGKTDKDWNNLFSPEGYVRFAPDDYQKTFSDPSYNLPSYFDYFAHYADADRPTWAKIAKATRKLLEAATGDSTPDRPNHANGVMTAYCTFDGKPFDRTYDPGTGIVYGGDALRTVSNIGVDYMWWATPDDPDFQFHQRWANRFLDYLVSKDPNRIMDWAAPGANADAVGAWDPGGKRDWYPGGLTADGSLIGNDPAHPWLSHFVINTAMNAVGIQAATTPNSYYYVQELAKTDISECGTNRPSYFDEVLFILGNLEATGNFRFYPVKNPK